MNILISNDDGINARGLEALIQALHEDAGAKIYVCVPDGQRSATSHGITMNKPITVESVELEHVELAYTTSGLPADCIKVGMEFLRRAGVHIDMVYSGINHGGNLGTDTLYSGTVAAAIEGSLCGVPSVAVSVDSHRAEHFDFACELAVNAAKALWAQIEAGTADHRMVLNINTPNKPREEIKGVKYTKLGPREYEEIFVPADMDSDEALVRREAARAAAAAKMEADMAARDAAADLAKAGQAGSVDAAGAMDADAIQTDAAPALGEDAAQAIDTEAAMAAADRAAFAVSAEEAELIGADEVKLPGSFRYSGTPVVYHDLPGDLDVVAHQEGYATITPIHSDLTHYAMVDEIRSWGLS